MEEVFLRYSHIAEQIFDQLDNENLAQSNKINKLWYNFIKNHKSTWFRMIKKYTKCSDKSMKKIIPKGDVKTVAQLAKKIKTLYKKYPNPSTKNKMSPVHEAAKQKNFILFQLVFENIEDKNPRNLNKKTPLHYAAEKGNVRICELIIANIAEKNPQDTTGKTPLHSAASRGHLEVYRAIMEKLENKNPGDNRGWTPLHSAAEYGHLEVCKAI